MNNANQPLIRVAKRADVSLKKKLLFNLYAVLAALVLGGVLVACLGYNPFVFYGKMISGPFSNPIYLRLLVRTIVPLLVVSLGTAIAFKMKFWNIGAEGQFIVGAYTAFTFGLLIGDSIPSFLAIILIIFMGALGAGLFGAIVAVFKVSFNTNETLMTLMLNYIALYFITYLLNSVSPFYVASGNGIPTFKILSNSVWLSEIKMGTFSFDTSVFIAIILVVMVFLYFKYTKQGYQINVVGDSPNTARYAGMKVGKIVIRTMFLSSAIIGVAGAMQVLGSSASHTLSTGITGGIGWTGIIIAWLAKLNPIAIVIATILMSILECGTSIARTSMGISNAVADILQGVILFSIIAFDFFINYQVFFRKRRVKGIKNELTQYEEDKGVILDEIISEDTDTSLEEIKEVNKKEEESI